MEWYLNIISCWSLWFPAFAACVSSESTRAFLPLVNINYGLLNSWSKWGRGVKEDESKIKDNKYNRPMMESVKRNITIYLALFETGSSFLFKCILLSNSPFFFFFFFLSKMKKIVKLMSAYTHTRPRAFAICTVNSPSCFQDREVAPTEPLRGLNRKIYDSLIWKVLSIIFFLCRYSVTCTNLKAQVVSCNTSC